MNNDHNAWVDISLPINDQIEEAISNFLFELGCVGCYSDGKKLHGYFDIKNWSKEKSQSLRRYLQELKQLGFQVLSDKIEIAPLSNRDWNQEWKKNYQPIEIGQKIIIKPSWIEVKCPPDKICVEIDPQMAFGTGTHATTQLVIELLLKQKQSFSRILDIGTGTGILAIIAAKIFSGKVYAFDNNPIAVATAKINAFKNGTESSISFFCSEKIILKNLSFDLILANITRLTIERYLPEIRSRLARDGKVIFSGILIEEKERFYKSLHKFAFDVESEIHKDEWIGILARMAE